VHHAVTEFEIGVGRDRVQVADIELGVDDLATALELEVHGTTDVVVHHLFERLEFRDQLAVHANQHVAGLQRAIGRSAGQHFADDQHAGERGERLARGLLGLFLQAEPAQFVVRRVVEHHLERATCDGLARLQHLERALHAAER
jgi:hypothetical protein